MRLVGCRTGRGGEIRRPSRRVLGIAAAILLAAAPAALAGEPPVPWAGGTAVETPVEQFAGAQASVAAGRPVTVSCSGANDWNELGAEQRFDPVTVWGFVVFDWDGSSSTYRPGDSMQLSEAACWYLDEYWRAPRTDKGKRCRTATHISFVRRGRRQIAVYTARFGPCPDYRNRIFALQTIAHESQHLAGIHDEATAECNGMQRFAWFAQRFGATAAQARQMAGDYFRDFYSVKRPGTPYYLPDCPNPANR